jgi:hypothetical protein
VLKLSFTDIFWMFWHVDSKLDVDMKAWLIASGITSKYNRIHIFAGKIFVFNLALCSLAFPSVLKQKFSGVVFGDMLTCFYIVEICSHLERKGVSRECLMQLAKEAFKEGDA